MDRGGLQDRSRVRGGPRSTRPSGTTVFQGCKCVDEVACSRGVTRDLTSVLCPERMGAIERGPNAPPGQEVGVRALEALREKPTFRRVMSDLDRGWWIATTCRAPREVHPP